MVERALLTSEQGENLPFALRIKFWLNFVRTGHKREMHLLLHKAKLGKKPRKVADRWEGWNNVIKHQAGEAIAMRMLGEALQLPGDQIERQERFAFVHDARKHIEKAPYRDFTACDRRNLDSAFEEILDEVDPERRLSIATNEEFFYKLFERTDGMDLDAKITNTPQDELLQYYIDSIFIDGTITPPLERIAKTEARRQDLNEDTDRQRRLGMKYWDAERIVAEKVETLVWELLGEKGIHLASPRDVPNFICTKIHEAIKRHSL